MSELSFDEEVFAEEYNKLRQLLGALSTLLLNNNEIISDLLDDFSFTVFSNNKETIQQISNWLFEPNFYIEESENLDEIINLLKCFMKRVYHKNKKSGVLLVPKKGELTVQYNNGA